MHDEVWQKIAPEVITECSLDAAGTDICSSAGTVAAVAKIVGANGAPPEIISAAKTKTGCSTEKCAITKLADEIGEIARKDIETAFKASGPTDSSWLTNTHLDGTLIQWAATRPDFFPYNFNMVDYAKYSFKDGTVIQQPDSLATVNFADLYSRGYRTAACVINTDRYNGNGKHWMALFIDARSPTVWSVEFFNSSGQAPQPEYVNWLEKTRTQLERTAAEKSPRPDVRVIRVSKKRHQNSTSECGVYSLYYIRARLEGVPADYFATTLVPDSNMFEFRHHLFTGQNSGAGQVGGRFDWDEYMKKVKIGWER